MLKNLTKYPSAWLPIVMSFTALMILLGHIIIFGIPKEPEADEGTAAHLFQLLMAGQIPIILYFIIKWLPVKPKQALQILTLQFIAGLVPIILLYYLEL